MAETGGRFSDRQRASGARIAGLTMRTALAAGALACLAACAQKPSYQAVCEDSHTGLRVPDQACQGHSASAAPGAVAYWVYFRSGQDAPAIGSAVSGGTRTPPEQDNNVSQGGVAPGGGPVEEENNGGSGTGGTGSGVGGSNEGGSGGDTGGSESGGGSAGEGGGEGGGGGGGGE